MLMGKYEMGRRLGEGHFGKVKLARHAETGRAFAIKILDRQRILAMKIDEQVRACPSDSDRWRWISSCSSKVDCSGAGMAGADKEGDRHAEAAQAPQRRPAVRGEAPSHLPLPSPNPPPFPLSLNSCPFLDSMLFPFLLS
jgi:hypothetical protein